MHAYVRNKLFEQSQFYNLSIFPLFGIISTKKNMSHKFGIINYSKYDTLF